ncbi:MAG TPA: DUF1707 domain-containing protein [Streptosporangiaceae bacterium]|nr:DUF1707 domain-containing protein [Streptosporangiaceae bacterium]
MATGPDLRIGDAEREAVSAELREHYAQGRLTLEEFNQRLEAVFKASTRRDLNSVTSDLPHATAPSTPLPVANASGYDRSGQDGAWRSQRRARLGLFPVIIAALATWLVVFELHLRMFPWPGKLAIFLAALGVIRGLMRRVFGMGRGGARGPRRVRVRRRF